MEKDKSTSKSQANEVTEVSEQNLSLGRMERNFCSYFGATPSLPKMKKKTAVTQRNELNGEETRDLIQAKSENFQIRKLKQVYERLEEIEKLKEESQKIIDEIKSEKGSSANTTQPDENSKSEGGLIFDFTKTPDANSFSLPVYFHKNMQSLQGILPLTIFNRAWQQAASNNHVDYRKQDKEVERYRGHRYPGEWTQSRFEWNENMDCFISSCRDTYKFIGFADALEIHKKNVITIFKQQRSWVVAFRYDLTIRKATFAIRNPGEAIPNPALEPPGLLNEIYYAARAQDDLNTEDNPYRKGGPKVGRNPYSDIITEPASHSLNYHTNQRPAPQRYNTEQSQIRPQSPYGNYKGKRFNPNYKKQDNVKPDNKEKAKDKKV